MPTKPGGGDKPRKKDTPPDASKTSSSSESAALSQKPVKSSSGGVRSGPAMGARWSGGGGAGSSGKAPSTVSGSSTHTASTMPADSADGKSKSSTLPVRGAGVTSFLRKKPASKTSSSEADRRKSEPVPEAGAAGDAKKPAKKAGTLRSSLFKRKSKTPATESSVGPSEEKGRPPSGRGAGSPPKAPRPASRGSTGSAEAPAPKRKTPSPAPRKTPSPAPRQSPSHPAESKAVTSGVEAAKPPSTTGAAAGGHSPDKTGAGRGSKALTPAQKEALKKQWFTEGQPAPTPQPRSSARLAAARAGETVEPPAKVSRVSNAAAKFGPTVKAAPKARPASPKKPGRTTKAGNGSEKPVTASVHSKTAAEKVPGTNAAKPTVKNTDTKSASVADTAAGKNEKSSVTEKRSVREHDMSDFMDSMSGFKPKDTSGSDASGSKASVAAAIVNVPAGNADQDRKGDTKDNSEGMADLMDAMTGFNPGGSSGDSETKHKDKETDHKHTSAGAMEDNSRNAKQIAEKEKPVRPEGSTETTGTAGVGSPGENAASSGSSAPAAAADLVNKVVDKAILIAGDDSPDSKAEKKSFKSLGDEDTGELGLGGISEKDRREWAERPKSPKAAEADLDFLSSVIDTAPVQKETPTKAEKKDSRDQGLSDLMELSLGLDMSSKPKDKESSGSGAKSGLASGDMDKFLDIMSAGPVKPSAPPPPAQEITEEHIKEKKWRTGDDDDVKMNELRNKKRDFEAPAQSPDWDIDDLLIDAVPTKPSTDSSKSSANAEQKSKAGGGTSDKGFSGFDDFLSTSLSGIDKHEGGDKPKPTITDKAKETNKKSDPGSYSGFDDLLSESLSAPSETSLPCKEDVIAAPKKSAAVESAPKPPTVEETVTTQKVSGVTSAPKRSDIEEVVSAVAASQVTASPSGGSKSRHVEKEGNTRGSVPDHGHGVRDLLYDDSDKTGWKSSDGKQKDNKTRAPAVLDDLILPKKASSVSSAPPAEETLVAHSASSVQAGPPASGRKVAGKHVEKEGDTRGSVPDHGHGVRGLLYDDDDKTGLKGKQDTSKMDSKLRDPVLLDDLVVPKKSSASHSQPQETAISAETSHQSHAKPSGKHDKPSHTSEKAPSATPSNKDEDCSSKICDTNIEKHGDTRGSCPDHGHGVRDVLYDDSDKTGRGGPKKTDAKPREPADLDDLVVPKKANVSHTTPHEESISPKTSHQAHSEPKHKQTEKAASAEKAHATESSHKDIDKKAHEKHIERHGDTRGSCPDHGHGVRDVLYEDSDKTGKNEPKKSNEEKKQREPVMLDDLVVPKKSGVSHAVPHESVKAAEASQAHSQPSDKHEEKLSAKKVHAVESVQKGKGGDSKTREKHVEKHGDTRGSCPDRGHGVRDVLYDDSDKTGKHKKDENTKHSDKPRDPVVLDDLILPKQAVKVSSAAPSRRSPSTESEDDEVEDGHLTAATAQHTKSAPPPLSKSKKRRNRKKNKAKHAEKEGDTRGSVPDHGHQVRDLLYDDSDKTGLTKPSSSPSSTREPVDLDALIRPSEASSAHTAHSAPSVGQEVPLVVATEASVAHAAPPTSQAKKKPNKSLSLAGMTDPEADSDSDGEELRRLIESTEALQHQLHACGVLADHTQAEAAQTAAGRELEQLESQLVRREAKLAAAGKHKPELQAAKDQLQKAKQQLHSEKVAK